MVYKQVRQIDEPIIIKVYGSIERLILAGLTPH